jgi:hypothetical protein
MCGVCCFITVFRLATMNPRLPRAKRSFECSFECSYGSTVRKAKHSSRGLPFVRNDRLHDWAYCVYEPFCLALKSTETRTRTTKPIFCLQACDGQTTKYVEP